MFRRGLKHQKDLLTYIFTVMEIIQVKKHIFS